KTSYSDLDVYTLGVDEKINFGIIHAGSHSLLFYPFAQISQVWEKCSDALKSDENLKYVLLAPDDILTKELVHFITKDYPQVVFLSDADTIHRYQLLFPHLSYQLVKKDDILALSPNHQLKFIFTPFIAQFNSFIVFDLKANILISNLLFSNPNNNLNNAQKALLAFHEQRIPSSDFLRPLMKNVQKLKPQLIIPYYGEPLSNQQIPATITLLANFVFYNSTYLVKRVSGKRRIFNYLNLGNQILIQLKNLYGEAEVSAVFQGTDIEIDPTSMEITKAPTSNEQLWHNLFSIILDKKGPAWLAVLEKTVNKLNSLYNIKKPNVYRSLLVSSKFKALELQSQFSSLQESYNEVTDQLSRCPLTKAFNEMFLRNLLRKKINDIIETNSEDDWVLLFIDIDNIRKLNLIHSKEIGDETIRNLYYLLNQVKEDQQDIFKRNGPGFVLLCPQYDYAKSLKLAEKIRNAVETSDTFIERITVSVAIVRLHEFPPDQRKTLDMADLWFERGETRIKLAPSLGFNHIIDERIKGSVLSIGKILIVDTDEIIHNILELALNSINYEVVIAKNGMHALEIAQTQIIDLIICEKNIPKLDGFQIKSRLNLSLETQTIPFILTTFNKNKEIVVSANQLGIDIILTKPLIVEEVLGLVSRLTAQKVRL
ncbi:MAG TPA: response regulator, partial [Bacilli bacterium]|nr:response regulator [Bacilli bacterium]